MDEARVRKLADGRVYSGAQAKELGLVDQFGTLEDAIELAAKQAGPGRRAGGLLFPPGTGALVGADIHGAFGVRLPGTERGWLRYEWSPSLFNSAVAGTEIRIQMKLFSGCEGDDMTKRDLIDEVNKSVSSSLAAGFGGHH